LHTLYQLSLQLMMQAAMVPAAATVIWLLLTPHWC